DRWREYPSARLKSLPVAPWQPPSWILLDFRRVLQRHRQILLGLSITPWEAHSMSDAKERARRNFGGDQTAAIVRRHLADKVPVSDLADEYQVQPSLIYLWIRQVL